VPAPTVALSLKQPWAALLIAGLKTVEIRKWSTQRLGPLWIHAAKIDDPRPEAWAWLPDDFRPLAELRGGVIGQAVLTGCVTYTSRRAFAADRILHLNHPTWFQPPALYGFTFSAPEIVDFRPAIGNIKFFAVP
jgi:hypothetical protein